MTSNNARTPFHIQACKTKSPTIPTSKCVRRNRGLNSQYDRMLGTEVTASPTCACPAPSPARQLGTEFTPNPTQSPAPTICSPSGPRTEAPVVSFVEDTTPSSAPSCFGKPDCPDVPYVITPPPYVFTPPPSPPGTNNTPPPTSSSGINTPPPSPPCSGPNCPDVPGVNTSPPTSSPSVCPPCPDLIRTPIPTFRPTQRPSTSKPTSQPSPKPTAKPTPPPTPSPVNAFVPPTPPLTPCVNYDNCDCNMVGMNVAMCSMDVTCTTGSGQVEINVPAVQA